MFTRSFVIVFCVIIWFGDRFNPAYLVGLVMFASGRGESMCWSMQVTLRVFVGG